MTIQSEVITLNVGGGSGDYTSFLLNKPASGQSYGTITSAAAASTTTNNVTLRTTGTDFFDWCTYVDIAVDLREYLMLIPNLTNALLYFTGCSYYQGANKAWFPTTVGISGQRESVRGTNSQLLNYHEIYQGAFGGTDYATQINLTSFSGNVGFYLNAAGIAYLNTVGTKTYNPGYAFFSMLFGNQIDGTPPSTPLTAASEEFDFTAAYLILYYDDAAATDLALNYGPSGFNPVLGAKVNISNLWKTITEIKVNVGDVWKDVI